MTISLDLRRAALLCVVWAFAVLLGVSIGFNVPFLLLVLWTVLVLLGGA